VVATWMQLRHLAYMRARKQFPKRQRLPAEKTATLDKPATRKTYPFRGRDGSSRTSTLLNP
jgi:hypothetical protein